MARVDEWIERAKGSLEIAQIKIVGHIHYEDLCFQIQQAAEKALKGLIIFYGAEPEFTHNIELLLTELEKFTAIPQDVRQAMKLTAYAVQTRYPGGYDDITKEEYEKAIKIAQDCLDWVEKKIAEKNNN